jgi:hypothetical protein
MQLELTILGLQSLSDTTANVCRDTQALHLSNKIKANGPGRHACGAKSSAALG